MALSQSLGMLFTKELSDVRSLMSPKKEHRWPDVDLAFDFEILQPTDQLHLLEIFFWKDKFIIHDTTG